MATETIINRPAPFVEDIGKQLKDQAIALQNVPVVTTGPGGLTKGAGETDQGFADRQNAARAFEVRKQNLAGIAPQVAGQDVLQQERFVILKSVLLVFYLYPLQMVRVDLLRFLSTL